MGGKGMPANLAGMAAATGKACTPGPPDSFRQKDIFCRLFNALWGRNRLARE
jgi:hypothetical protein